jgi:hypothetical protein
MSDAGKRLPAMRPDECSRDCDVACRHREGAMGALATIMADQTAAPIARIIAANSILEWSAAGRAAEVAASGKKRPKLPRVGIEWSDPATAR